MTAHASSVFRPDSRFAGHDLTCIRGERVVFTGLDFALGAGEAVLLLGPNGSGKSSLLRVMAGLLRPATGKLTWGVPKDGQEDGPGDDGPGDGDDRAANTRYIGHHDAIKPVLTVAENISFWVRQWRPDIADVRGAVAEGLARFDMERLIDVPGKMLSAGQKRRVNLARLFAAPAPLWLLDEPTTALDKASVKVLENAIADHRAGGGMVVVSTHMDIALPHARTVHMDDYAADAEALDAAWEVA